MCRRVLEWKCFFLAPAFFTGGGKMDTFTQILQDIDNVVWGIPLILLILGCGVWLTIRIAGAQFRHFGLAVKFMFRNESGGRGEIPSFAAFCTGLSATIGTSNIVGVATAIAAGGPGALLWMDIAALFGMATKYAEAFLGVKYRTRDREGRWVGGPFYYIERGMGRTWRWLAKLFAIFGFLAGILGIGTITQMNSISDAVNDYFHSPAVEIGPISTTLATIISGFAVTVTVALVVVGSLRRIALVSQIIVPLMTVIYIICCLVILCANSERIPSSLLIILEDAFGLRELFGGILGSFAISVQKGVARGIYSNEAGLGSTPIATAAAQTKDPVRQGLVTMNGAFLGTIVICTLTGLTILVTGAWETPGLDGTEIAAAAFQNGLPLPALFSSFLLMICITLFAYTTILGWHYYSERCFAYLFGKTSLICRWLFVAIIFVSPYFAVEAVWDIADIFNGLMALPNVVALFALSGVVGQDTKRYFATRRYAQRRG